MPLLSGPHEPAWVLARAYAPLFEKIRVDSAWVETMRAASKRGSVVHVVRNVSVLDLLALDHLMRRLDLPCVGFANELGAWLGPTRFWQPPASRFRATLASGESAVLFMKRHPSVIPGMGGAHRGRTEGTDLLRVLIEAQRQTEHEIMMVPQTLVWTQRSERRGFSVVDTLFGSTDFPGELRAAGQLVLNHKNCVVRAGEPFSLRDLLAQEDGGDDDAVIARRLTYALLRKVERERRTVLGPVQKPTEQVREEVLKSPKLRAFLRDLAGPGDEGRGAVEDKARAILRELAATPDAGTLKGLELVGDALVDHVYAEIDIDLEGIDRVREAARKGTLVLLPSHKSHVDYLLLSFVMRKHGLMIPVIAAGDNLSFFPLGPVFRRAGAFFIRRSFKGDRLYAAVVDAYIRRLLRDGHTVEIFLEGGRSRTGKLLSPKVGLLNMVVGAALTLSGRPIFFVPVSIGYERTMEEGAYARELSGAQKRKEDVASLLNLGGVLREKYGRVTVQFGQVIALDALRAQLGITGEGVSPAKRRSLVARLAHQVMSELNRVTAVTPGSLVALALLCHGRRGIPHVELVGHCDRLVRLVRHLGARTTPSLSSSGSDALREQAVREAALLYVRGGIVRQHVPGDTLTGTARKRGELYLGDDVIYTVPHEQRLLLDFSKNIIIHLFVDRALVSLALVTPPGVPTSQSVLRERVQALSRLFKFEFMFRADAPFDRIFDDTLADMVATGEVVFEGDNVTFGAGHDGLDGSGWITFYAAVVRNFVEAYGIAARAVRLLTKGPLPEKELIARALRIGEQMFLGGELERAEAVSQPTIENAIAAFIDLGYLRRASDKLALTEPFMSEDTVKTIEGEIASYLRRRTAKANW